MPLDDVVYLRLLERNIPAPLTKPALRVHALHPRIQRQAFRAVLFGILTLDLQHQNFAIRKSNQKIGHKTLTRAVPKVMNLKAKMVILGISQDAFLLGGLE